MNDFKLTMPKLYSVIVVAFPKTCVEVKQNHLWQVVGQYRLFALLDSPKYIKTQIAINSG